MADNFHDDQLETSPPWLMGPFGKRWAQTLGDSKDDLASQIRQAVKAKFPGKSVDRTNQLTYSQDYTNSAWTKTQVTIGATGTAPDGSSTALKMIENASVSVEHYVEQILSASPSPDGAIATCSAQAAASSRGWLFVAIVQRDGSTVRGAWFNLTTGTIGTVDPGIKAAVIPSANVATGQWYRCCVSGSVGTGSNAPRGRVKMGSADNQSTYIGDGTSFLWLWGSQFESGSGPTSYIPTTATPVTVSIADANSAPSDALPIIGLERGLPRGISEPDSQYRARLTAAWDAWTWAGTPYGMLRAFQLAGYPNVLLQCQSGKQYQLGAGGTISDLVITSMTAPVHLGGSPSELWSDISVIILQPWPSWWGRSPSGSASSWRRPSMAELLESSPDLPGP